MCEHKQPITYSDWIEANVSSIPSEIIGTCRETCIEMSKFFPELIQKCGFYKDPIWGDRQHFWLQTPSGEIIDPTELQFPGYGVGSYHPLDEKDRPIGKCLNCGKLVYSKDSNESNICSKKCGIEFRTSLMR
jgi:hypothetical protein